MKYDYDGLSKEYPEIVSLEQMRVICKIAKRSAKYLLDHDIVPSENNGKKTRQYKIRLNDIITYLQVREKWGSQIPVGSLNSQHKSTRNSFMMVVSPGMEKDMAAYFEYLYSDCPENLGVPDIEEMTGLAKDTIRRYIQKGKLKSLKQSNQYLIPKCWLIEFLTSTAFLTCSAQSKTFLKLLGGFQLWINQKQKS